MIKKNPTAKFWKQSHYSRRNTEQLDDSVASNHSSLSSGYNRFKFQPKEASLEKRSNLFQYTARNREKPLDVGELTKRSVKTVSRKSLDINIPQHDNCTPLDAKNEESGNQKFNNKPVIDIAKELKFLAHSLKRTIQYFARQLRDLKHQWDTSIKELLKRQISFQNSAIFELRACLQQKEKELQRFKNEFTSVEKKMIQKEPLLKMRHAQSITEAGSLSKLGISQIEVAKTHDFQHHLSRDNTLKQLLGDHKSSPRSALVGFGRPKQQLTLLRQTVRQMREVLDVQV